ncbi:MAG: sugar ABC transporter substrate-binding protein [Christensenellales bacterium]|jgi:putative aldouronate transport system substrate-binding protein
MPRLMGGKKGKKINISVVFIALILFACACAHQPVAHPEEAGAFGLRLEGYPITEEKLSLRALQYELDSQVIDFANMWFYKELEALTNVRVEFEEVKQSDWETKLNLMFASGIYTDLIIRGSLNVEEYGVIQKAVIPLDDYLEEFMPNYYSRLALNNSGAGIPASDGLSYFVGFLISQEINADGHWFINKSWLDRLNLEVPTTIDSLTEVLRAFKMGDPNGNGQADEIPYQATFNNTNTGLYNMFAAWGIAQNEEFIVIDDSGQVQFTARMDGYRQCLEWLNLLYREKLIDQECITQDANIWGMKVNQDTSGFFTYWRLLNSAVGGDMAEQFVCMLPVSAEGYQARVSSTMELAQFGAAITVQNQYPQESLRWLDAQMETEIMMISQNGKLGDTLAKEEDGKFRVLYVPESNALYDIVPVICGQFFGPKDYYNKIYNMAPHRAEKAGYCRWYTESGVMEPFSFQNLTMLAPLSAEDATDINTLYSDIERYMTESITKFITTGVDDSSWQSFIGGLDSIGVEEYIRAYQGAYDKLKEK